MSFELFRDINQVLPFLAFMFLMFRVVKAWPASWAKPHLHWHYRFLLVLLSGYTFLSGLIFIDYETAVAATWISPLYTLQAVIILALCVKWPKQAR